MVIVSESEAFSRSKTRRTATDRSPTADGDDKPPSDPRRLRQQRRRWRPPRGGPFPDTTVKQVRDFFGPRDRTEVPLPAGDLAFPGGGYATMFEPLLGLLTRDY